jgi:multidrug resistance efflux pump
VTEEEWQDALAALRQMQKELDTLERDLRALERDTTMAGIRLGIAEALLDHAEKRADGADPDAPPRRR